MSSSVQFHAVDKIRLVVDKTSSNDAEIPYTTLEIIAKDDLGHAMRITLFTNNHSLFDDLDVELKETVEV